MLARLAAREISAVVGLAAEDIRAVCANDPAARVRARGRPRLPGPPRALGAPGRARALAAATSSSARASSRTRTASSPASRSTRARASAARVFIDHGMGIVIGETATVGDGCLLYKGVVLGGTSLERKVRHPQVGDDVVIGSNACILGTIHDRRPRAHRLGERRRRPPSRPRPRSSACPRGSSCRKHARFDAALDHANLPDPVTDMIRALAEQNERLRERVDVPRAASSASCTTRSRRSICRTTATSSRAADGG